MKNRISGGVNLVAGLAANSDAPLEAVSQIALDLSKSISSFLRANSTSGVKIAFADIDSNIYSVDYLKRRLFDSGRKLNLLYSGLAREAVRDDLLLERVHTLQDLVDALRVYLTRGNFLNVLNEERYREILTTVNAFFTELYAFVLELDAVDKNVPFLYQAAAH